MDGLDLKGAENYTPAAYAAPFITLQPLSCCSLDTPVRGFPGHGPTLTIWTTMT